MTGESLPVTKGPGDGVYSGSTVKQGEIEAVVIATGVHTFFGKAAHLVDSTNQVGHFQKARLKILSLYVCILDRVISVLHCLYYYLTGAGLDVHWELLYLLNCCGDVC